MGLVATLFSKPWSSVRTGHLAFIDISKIHKWVNRYWVEPPNIVWWFPNGGCVDSLVSFSLFFSFWCLVFFFTYFS